MGVVFRAAKRGGREYFARFSYTSLHHFRAALAKSAGWPDWVAWHDAAIRTSFGISRTEEIPDPPSPPARSRTWKMLADLINASDTEGRIPRYKLKGTIDALDAFGHEAPFFPKSTPYPHRLSDLTWLDQARYELRCVLEEARKAKVDVIYD